ncbi:MAG: glycosyltransferase [Shewanella sp.]
MTVDFTFASLVYNHSDYIIEHLESIKYQIEKYANGAKVKLVISDDGSTDSSLEKINAWLLHNDSLFYKSIIIGDGVNKGVGYSFTSIWEHIEEEPFKILAGDDVYSYENIFEEAKLLNQFDFVTGLPLLLVNGVIKKSNPLIFNMLATQYIYQKKSFFSKIKNISVIHTPSLIYKNCFIHNPNTLEFIRSFLVTEDFPMMAKLSSIYKMIDFKTVGKVYVYYRRTSGSIYLVDNDRYNYDKEKVFDYLEELDDRWIGRFLLRNRKFCYRKGGMWGKMLNINYYLYAFRVMLYFPKIISAFFSLQIDDKRHAAHYAMLVSRAKEFHF